MILLLFMCGTMSQIISKEQTSFYQGLIPEVNFYSESGYGKLIDGDNDSQLFYELHLQQGITEITKVTDQDYLILWIYGGPGSSSTQSSYLENGPFIYEDDKLTLRTTSWNKYSHLLYLDQPFGTGFSHSNRANLVNNCDDAAGFVVQFMKLFFAHHPEFKTTKFYIMGESFAGHYIPVIGAQLLEAELGINYQGIAIGGPWTNLLPQVNHYGSYLYSYGLISKSRMDKLSIVQSRTQQLLFDQKYAVATVVSDGIIFRTDFMDQLNPYNIHQYTYDDDEQSEYIAFLNSHKEQYNIPTDVNYVEDNNDIYAAFYDDQSRSRENELIYLLSHGKVLIYNGQFDYVVNTPGTQELINGLKWGNIYNYKQQPKQIWHYGDNIVGGSIKQYHNLNVAIVYGAGHMTPTDQPDASLQMMHNYITGVDWV